MKVARSNIEPFAEPGGRASETLSVLAELARRAVDCDAVVMNIHGAETFALATGNPEWAGANMNIATLVDPLAATSAGLEFYIAIPIRSADDADLGELIAIGSAQRAITAAQLDTLKVLARIVSEFVTDLK